MRTNELRKDIVTVLNTLKTTYGLKGIYYKHAIDDKMYPHITYTLTNVNTGDLNRLDYLIDVDVWDKGAGYATAENIADAVEKAFSANNRPNTKILPTYFTESRGNVDDEDKDVRHIVVKLSCQLYDIETE